MSFLKHAVDHYRSTFCILALILLVGLYARSAMVTEANPQVSVPVVVISVFHDGISPQDGARL